MSSQLVSKFLLQRFWQKTFPILTIHYLGTVFQDCPGQEPQDELVICWYFIYFLTTISPLTLIYCASCCKVQLAFFYPQGSFYDPPKQSLEFWVRNPARRQRFSSQQLYLYFISDRKVVGSIPEDDVRLSSLFPALICAYSVNLLVANSLREMCEILLMYWWRCMDLSLQKYSRVAKKTSYI